METDTGELKQWYEYTLKLMDIKNLEIRSGNELQCYNTSLPSSMTVQKSILIIRLIENGVVKVEYIYRCKTRIAEYSQSGYAGGNK